MKKLILLTALLIAANVQANDDMIRDGVVGAIVGGIIGNNIGDGDSRSGAVIGAISGIIIGDNDRNHRYNCGTRNYRTHHHYTYSHGHTTTYCRKRPLNIYHKVHVSRDRVWVPAYTIYGPCGEILDIVPGRWIALN